MTSALFRPLRQPLQGVRATCLALLLACGGLFSGVVPAMADYEAGVEAWQNGQYEDAAREFAKAANEGDKRAEYSLGMMFRKGEGVEKDLAKSAWLLVQSANKGWAAAVVEVALGKINGANGFDKDRTEGIRLMRLAAEAGNIAAIQALSQIHLQKNFPQYDPLQAQKWLTMGAEAGDLRSMLSLGELLISGQIGTADPVNASRWYRKAAEAGYTAAQRALALLYYTGKIEKVYDINQGLVPNYPQAHYWFEQAARRGDPVSQRNAGLLGVAGAGGKEGKERAIMWFNIAAHSFKRGSDERTDMLQKLKALKKELGDITYARMQRKAGSFRPLPDGTPIQD